MVSRLGKGLNPKVEVVCFHQRVVLQLGFDPFFYGAGTTAFVRRGQVRRLAIIQEALKLSLVLDEC